MMIALCDGLLLPVMVWLAVCLRYGEWRVPGPLDLLGYAILPLIALPLFLRTGLYRAVTRYLADRAVLLIIGTVSLVMLAYAGLALLIGQWDIPRSAFLITWLLVVFYMLASRFAVRLLLRRYAGGQSRRAVLIYGAGSAGRQLAIALNLGMEYKPVGFLDDDFTLHGLDICGLTVFRPEDLGQLIRKKQVGQVLLAMPSVSRNRRIELVNWLEPYHVEVKVVPGIADLVSGQLDVSDIRTVDVDELLGREAVPPDEQLLVANIDGKVVMVTGAGGSIGAELCRQIARFGPLRLVLYEQSEFALYTIEQELQRLAVANELALEIVPVLGSVQNGLRVGAIMQRYGVQTVYHAAAYKHVPLVEFNITEGVFNNTFGTLATAQAALHQGVETFVLISTDKAVRPTNVMGASKRMAELVLQALADAREGGTRFCMVRFGNVLGSSGSVVPLFKRQLDAGGPLTVTHPEITRYFMTIPEAAQLVIQAGAMAESGEVFVLDMGQPVKIADLARRMIHLSGYSIKDEHNPFGEIELRYTGLRPGEKLYEELLIGENVLGTSHPRIMKAREEFYSKAEMDVVIARLAEACASNHFDCIMTLLHQCVADFKPDATIKDHLHYEES
ncbi:polysaccharide biosynthesis protein [Chitiniphilus purpureus]|uniref:Polysaccharide biosynthesis protein n=1 Tax=Chitiniphilus purpureus TaxID=2981137 RepID=A0ABY6DJE6_9NEIS|nr:nucleoside-diphosphate sugar epimerase/dehydratase [Chitiniphilus sp. CD1]UXY14469.1 polysaccharide biosynthesis protein [Chitiniphilus sp. CD1]